MANNTGTSSSPKTKHDVKNSWRQMMMTLYPDLFTRTHFVPPVHFNRVPYTRDTVAEQPVLLLQQPLSDGGGGGGTTVLTSAVTYATPGFDASTSDHLGAPTVGETPATSCTGNDSTLSPKPATSCIGNDPTGSKTAATSCIQNDSTLSPKPAISCAETDSTVNAPPASSSTGVDSTFGETSATSTKNDSDVSATLATSTTGTDPTVSATPSQPMDCVTATAAHSDDASSVRSGDSPSSTDVMQSSLHSLWAEDIDLLEPPEAVYDCDTREDFSQHHLLLNLQCLGEDQQEVMFIVSQLEFTQYLSHPAYAETTAYFPRPADLGKQLCRGDFDVLIIHRKYGILIVEVKSTGLYTSLVNPLPPDDAVITKRVERATKQLDRYEKMVRYLLKDLAPGMTVRKTLAFPYVSASQLQRVLEANAKLGKMVCRTLGTETAAGATALCICSDHLSDCKTFWRVTPVTLSRLSDWWKLRMTCTVDPLLTDDVYLDIVARFAGPASSVNVHCVVAPRVEVRTEGQAVSELGRRLSRLVLTPDQLRLMTTPLQRVCVTGPPGTGKTIMLVLIGLWWMIQGHDVHVLSCWHASLGASHLIYHQLQKTVEASHGMHATAGKVHLHYYDIQRKETDVKRAVNDMTLISEGRQLCVIIDEAPFAHNTSLGPRSQSLVTELLSNVPNVSLWVACIPHVCIPSGLQIEPLRFPLRCAPTVLREVVHGVDGSSGKGIYSYANDGVPSPADGPSVIRLYHQGKGHTTKWPDECYQCGRNLAEQFRRLNIGADENTSAPNGPPPLQFRDVFVLTRSGDLREEVKDASGKVTKEASGVARALRDAGFPVCITGYSFQKPAAWLQDIADIAVSASNKVTMARWGAVSGLERKVVVWLFGWRKGPDDRLTDQLVEAEDRLVTVSRCTTQLIIVEVPTPDQVTS